MRRVIGDFVLACFAAGRRPSTVASYKSVLYQLLKYAGRDKMAWPLTVEDLRGFLAYKRAGGCKEITIKSYYKVLSRFFNWCEANDLLDGAPNPALRLDIPRDRQRIPRVVDQATLKKLFDTMAAAAQQSDRLATRDHALYRLIYDTGIRNGEASNARLDDLDLVEQSLLIRQAKGLPRVVYFGRSCVFTLRSWLAVRVIDSEWLFTGPVSARLGTKGIYGRLQYWCDVAGIPHMRVHDLRHSHATHALRLGIPITDVQHQLGHSRLSTTELYLWSFDGDRQQAYRRHSPGDELLKLNTVSGSENPGI